MAARKPGDGEPEKTQALLRALSHQVRREIMRMLAAREEPLSPSEAARQLTVPLPNASYHFRRLAQAGAVNLAREAPIRGTIERFYAADPEVLAMPLVVAALADPPDS